MKDGFSPNGVFPVTEASATGILTRCDRIFYGAGHPSISRTDGPIQMHIVGIGRAVITCDGAGQFANVPLVAALAGYYGVLKITSIKCNAGVAPGAAGLTFESPAGTPALPTTEVNPALTANVRVTDWLGGTVITHATLVDNQAIVADSIGSYGAGAIVEIMFEWWYET
jgi:hypothetical protein